MKIKFVLGILLLLFSLYGVYNLGVTFGTFTGANAILKLNNQTICEDVLNMTIDNDDFCIVANNTEYSIKLNCPFGKFKTSGNKTLNQFQQILYASQKIIYYPLVRCW